MGGDRLNWHVITGPPCSGKSATIDALAARGFRVRREIARDYIEEELRAGRTLGELRRDISSFQPRLSVRVRAYLQRAKAPRCLTAFGRRSTSLAASPRHDQKFANV